MKYKFYQKGEKNMCFYGCANRDRYCENETSETDMPSYVKPFDKEKAIELSEQGATGVYTYNRIMTKLNDCIDRDSKRGQKKTYLTVTLYQQDTSILDKIVQDFEAAKYKAKFEAIKIPDRYKITVDWSEE